MSLNIAFDQYTTIVETLSELISEAIPPAPNRADFGPDPEENVILVEGCMILASSARDQLVQNLESLTEAEAKISDLVGMIVDDRERDTEDQRYTALSTNAQTKLVTRNARARRRTLDKWLVDAEVLRKGEDLKRRRATPAVAAPRVDPEPHGTPETRLPTIKLKPFTGKREEWFEFIELFSAAVDTASSATNVQKFSYLKSLLEGEPSKIIKGLPLTEDNYDVALALLGDRYGDKSVLIRELHNKLFSLKPCSVAEEVKSFQCEVESIARRLENLGENLDNAQSRLNIEQKLPRPLLKEVKNEERKAIAAHRT